MGVVEASFHPDLCCLQSKGGVKARVCQAPGRNLQWFTSRLALTLVTKMPTVMAIADRDGNADDGDGNADGDWKKLATATMLSLVTKVVVHKTVVTTKCRAWGFSCRL
jgi:hypothetical protein